ncbi:tetratricopeptide repeat protein [Synechococcus elongatus]|uniref:tetratricopeptide repeat-containing glycosyltransferase family protein n=1 Tax=Synechococcus elongatus TaxID=32046 RepID=UPI000F7EA6F6|nr:tetratricopeptide repeat-containing glycosyltransferase family protein [Synechococcus elongatus]
MQITAAAQHDYQQAIAAYQAGEFEAAIAQLDRLLGDVPDWAAALGLQGLCYYCCDQKDTGITLLRRAIALDPTDPTHFNNLGNLLQRQGHLTEALERLTQALAIDPTHVAARFNRAITLQKLGDPATALQDYQQLLEADPDNPEIRYNSAHAALAIGDWDFGLPAYEARCQQLQHFPEIEASLKLPRWQGQDLDQQTLLVWGEQGFGDRLMGARWIPLLRQRYPQARIVWQTSPSLVRLFQTLADDHLTVLAEGAELPACDWQVPLLSLMLIFQSDRNSLPWHGPYFFPRKGDFLPVSVRPRLGWVWSAGRNPAQSAEFAANKSCPLALLWSALSEAGWEVVSLQVDEARQDLQTLSDPLLDLGSEIGDFQDTVDRLAHLDLLITVDTAIAHLGGMIGLPTWVLLPAVPDWRWELSGATTPWYPSLRLFRQPSPGDWSGAIAELQTALAEFQPALQHWDYRGELSVADWIQAADRAFTAQNWPRAEWLIRQAVAIAPEEPSFHRALGRSLKQQGDYAGAAQALAIACELAPTQAEFWHERSSLEYYDNQLTAALNSLNQAIALQGATADHLISRGVLHYRLGQFPESCADYDAAAAIAPESPLLRCNRGFLQLHWGNWLQGWSDLEVRFDFQSDLDPFQYRQLAPAWQGEPLGQQTLLIWGEQGLGDHLLFCRWLPELRQQHPQAQLIFVTDPLLERLLQQLADDRLQICCLDEPVPACDRQVALMSLPAIAQTTPATVPWRGAYFQSSMPPLRCAETLQVGFVWASGKRSSPETARLYREKSCPLNELLPALLAVPAVDYYSFQVGADVAELQPWLEQSDRLFDLSEQLQDFQDTADWLAEMDVLISVDTAVANLAGMMALPVWTLLPEPANWRWGLTGHTTPWYPSMRLYRQTQRGDWSGAIAQIQQDLQQLSRDRDCLVT